MKLKLTKLTKDEILSDSEREYNPAEWTRIIERLSKYHNLEFYVQRKEDSAFDYDRFWAVYTIGEGIRLFNTVSYTGSLTNNGFCKVAIAADGTLTVDKTEKMENNKQNRATMAEISKENGVIFSNCI